MAIGRNKKHPWPSETILSGMDLEWLFGRLFRPPWMDLIYTWTIQQVSNGHLVRVVQPGHIYWMFQVYNISSRSSFQGFQVFWEGCRAHGMFQGALGFALRPSDSSRSEPPRNSRRADARTRHRMGRRRRPRVVPKS